MSRLLVVCSVSLLIAGCGSSGSRSHIAHRAQITTTPGVFTIPSPPPSGVAPDPAAVAVIRGWANALRRGDVQGAARYFALPSQMINGVGSNGLVQILKIDTVAEAAQANATLPCGARFVSADMRGRYVNALFRLTGRPGAGGTNCEPGAGSTARTNFVIADGRIVKWIRAPDDPGDNGTGPSEPPSGQAPVA